MKTLTLPIIECHLSNPATRERFRHKTYVSLVATGIVAGFGSQSYELAVRAAVKLVAERASAPARSSKV